MFAYLTTLYELHTGYIESNGRIWILNSGNVDIRGCGLLLATSTAVFIKGLVKTIKTSVWIVETKAC
jgi:hypothetical protein